MPQLLPIGFGQVLHELRLTGDPEPMAVTYGVKLDAGGVPDPALTCDQLHEFFFTAFGTLIANDYTLFSTELKWNESLGVGVQLNLHVEPKVCTSASAALPQNTAALISKRSAQAGRRHRGRLYLPGLAEGSVDAKGVINANLAGDFAAKLGPWLTNLRTLVPAVDEMVILHSTGISGAPTPTVVTQLLLDPIVSTQRRRLR